MPLPRHQTRTDYLSVLVNWFSFHGILVKGDHRPFVSWNNQLASSSSSFVQFNWLYSCAQWMNAAFVSLHRHRHTPHEPSWNRTRAYSAHSLRFVVCVWRCIAVRMSNVRKWNDIRKWILQIPKQFCTQNKSQNYRIRRINDAVHSAKVSVLCIDDVSGATVQVCHHQYYLIIMKANKFPEQIRLIFMSSNWDLCMQRAAAGYKTYSASTPNTRCARKYTSKCESRFTVRVTGKDIDPWTWNR